MPKDQPGDISDGYDSSDFAIEENAYGYISQNGIEVLLHSTYSGEYDAA